MTMEGDNQPEAVGASRKRAGDATETDALRREYAYASRTTWSEPMLRLLKNGKDERKWYSLIDKAYSVKTLNEAWALVSANQGSAGVDAETIAKFSKKKDERIESLSTEIRSGTYGPEPVRRVMIPKADGKLRPLGIPTVRDRVVQTALKLVLEPIFESGFSERSYGFRPGRGCKDALRRVVKLLRQGYVHVVDGDIKKFFDSIPHEKLMARISEKVADGKVLRLLAKSLEQGVMEGLSCWTPNDGTPQGSPISPLMANIYLHPLDTLMESKGIEMVRYADDFVILCKTKESAEAALAVTAEWMAEAGLQLQEEKTRLVDLNVKGEKFQFLGYVFGMWNGRVLLDIRESSLKKLRDTIRAKTPRSNGQSLEATIVNLGYTLRGWYAYFKHAWLKWHVSVDQFVRRRLRAILAHRLHLKHGHGNKYSSRWTNEFFRKRGLFSLEEARCTEVGVKRNH